MKSWIPFFIVCAIIVYIFYPFISRQRQCYVNSDDDLSRISSNVDNLRISKDTSCSQTTESLFNLETCISDATKSSMVAQYTNDMITGIVQLIRPFGKNLWTLKTEHNQSCNSSSKYQLQ
jgi:hypothetical protein